MTAAYYGGLTLPIVPQIANSTPSATTTTKGRTMPGILGAGGSKSAPASLVSADEHFRTTPIRSERLFWKVILF